MAIYTYAYWGDNDSIEMESPSFSAPDDREAVLKAVKDVGDALECVYCWKTSAGPAGKEISRAILGTDLLTPAEELLYCSNYGVYHNPSIPSK